MSLLLAAEPPPPPMYPHWVWLKMLKASARNSNEARSLIGKCLYNAISKMVWRGLRRMFRPASPKVSPRGGTKTEGFPKSGTPPVSGIPRVGSPIRSGYEPVPTLLPTPALSALILPDGNGGLLLLLAGYGAPPL